MHLFDPVKNLFKGCLTPQERYQLLIELGRNLPPLDPMYKTPAHLVKGCQSAVYLHTWQEAGLIYFNAASDALISAGLAALLIKGYNGQPPEIILTIKPLFLDELHIRASLSPTRSNGLGNMFLKMQQDVLKFLHLSTV